MKNATKTPKSTLKRLGRKSKAVSPVVATLVLIVVAIVGAISVGLIVSRVSTDTGTQANVNGAANGAQGQLLIGGSTTVYPITLALQQGFQSTYHVQLTISQGGSDAGMQGVISGALDIGAASSASAVNNAYTDVTTNNIQGVTINPTLLGGSGVVVIMNGDPANGGFLTDGVNPCVGITRAALKQIFSQATFGINANACAGPTYTLDVGGVAAAGTGIPVSRADNSGTQDQFASYTGLAKQSVGGNYPGTTEQGNPGVLNYVNTHGMTGTSIGSIGFVDLGFAEGAASGAVCPAGHASSTTCGVAMPQVDTAAPAAFNLVDAAVAAPAAGSNGYVASGTATKDLPLVANVPTPTAPTAAEINTANIHNLILSALKKAAFVNPLTLAGQVAQYPDSASPGTGLARTFYYVTNGPPTPVEEQFISYATNYNQESAYTNNGYFSQYDMTSA
ncbi:MAG TPA: substrate-binding domain-containing protein [Nitrososphaerales archaeon]|nr:substrate-binding domain-containing protein [Nitrososphaerales archaeon]